MKKTIYILTNLLFALTSCSTKIKTPSDLATIKNMQSDNSELNFEDYLKTIDQIPLPLSHNSLGKLPILSTNYNKKAFEKYKHVWTSQPLGILFKDEKTVTLVDCSMGDWGLVPFLTTYDRQGKKIDSLGPYKKSGQGMGYSAIEYLTINKDKTIIVKDTVTTYSLNANKTDIVETTKKNSTGITKYIIELNGRISESK